MARSRMVSNQETTEVRMIPCFSVIILTTFYALIVLKVMEYYKFPIDEYSPEEFVSICMMPIIMVAVFVLTYISVYEIVRDKLMYDNDW